MDTRAATAAVRASSRKATTAPAPAPADRWSANKQITSYAANPASGGGGGAAGVGDGGAGGGGGGVVELTARGDVTVTTVNANGGTGAAGSGLGASGGGGGAGGVILVRAGGTLTGLGDALDGQGRKGSTSAGAGSDGRTRYDAAMVAAPSPAPTRTAARYATAPDLFATLQTPMLTLSGEALDVGDVKVFTKDGDINDAASANFGTSGNATVIAAGSRPATARCASP